MNITPPLGIGDLLLLKMKELSNDLTINQINVSYQLLTGYRKYPENYLPLIKNFIKLLFPETTICVTNEKYTLEYLLQYNIKKTYLYDGLNFTIPITYTNYIIFHTKVRLDGHMDKFLNYDLPLLDTFFKNFKTDKTILILGEKKIEECYEQKIHNIISIYDNILQLSANNNVIDLTETELYSGNIDFNMFLKDIELINKADMNICFGIGGPLNLCQAFSKNNICYVSNFSHTIINSYIDINNNLYKDIESFIHTIYKINNYTNVMSIKTAVGLGDLLILKMRQVSHNLRIKQIVVSYNLIKTYRKYPEKAIQSINDNIKLLFPESQIILDYDTDCDNLEFFNHYNIKNTYIYDELNLTIPITYTNYIIFHTKVRLDTSKIDIFLNQDLPLLDTFFKNFKTDKTILILGEKKIEECHEQKILNIISIYDNILQLSANNNVIDLTEHELYSGNTNFDMFLNDIELINKADMNICFGIGGPLNLCQAFSKNNICYVSTILHPVLDEYININNSLYRDIESFIYTIYKLDIDNCLTNYSFSLSENNNYDTYYISALGIGDILISLTLLKNGLIKPPLVFNLQYFLNTITYPNPKNALIFRLELIKKIVNSNNIDNSLLVFMINHQNIDVNQHLDELKNALSPDKWTLQLSNDTIYVKPFTNYIIFHTKCRFIRNYDYTKLKNSLTNIFRTFKTTLPIFLLGEQTMVDTYEAMYQGITTIYNELLELKNNNNVIDLTVPQIYNTLDFKNYSNDVELIKNAKLNILIGLGGQTTTCLSFSIDNTIIFVDDNFLYSIFHNDIYTKIAYNNIDKFIDRIKSIDTPIDLDTHLDTICYIDASKNIDIDLDVNTEASNNILYLLLHKTLTEYELKILNNKGYGVLLPKKISTLSEGNSIYIKDHEYDKNLKNMSTKDIDILNKIDWFNNTQTLSNDIIEILNKNFKFIILTLLTTDNLLNQLVNNFKGNLYYRFFGRELPRNYNEINDIKIYNKRNNIKYIFSYPEIYNYELTLSNTFNNNSYVIPIGVPDYMLLYKNTYNPIINKIIFVCSKINSCGYYTNIYNTFIKQFVPRYNYVLLGKNNENLVDKNKINNLPDQEYYKTMSECKVMYYHSQEPRHLHYHPLEAIIIGIPIIFYEKSLLNSYLPNSPGTCKDINEVYLKLNKILNNDIEFINNIIYEQNKSIDTLFKTDIFDELINDEESAV